MPRWHVPWLTSPLKRAIRKKQRLHRKAKQLQTHVKKNKNQKRNTEQAFKTYNAYVSNLLDSTTNPDVPTLGKHFWSFIKSMKKDKVGISPLKKNGKGEAVHDGRKKALIRAI